MFGVFCAATRVLKISAKRYVAAVKPDHTWETHSDGTWANGDGQTGGDGGSRTGGDGGQTWGESGGSKSAVRY